MWPDRRDNPFDRARKALFEWCFISRQNADGPDPTAEAGGPTLTTLWRAQHLQFPAGASNLRSCRVAVVGVRRGAGLPRPSAARRLAPAPRVSLRCTSNPQYALRGCERKGMTPRAPGSTPVGFPGEAAGTRLPARHSATTERNLTDTSPPSWRSLAPHPAARGVRCRGRISRPRDCSTGRPTPAAAIRSGPLHSARTPPAVVPAGKLKGSPDHLGLPLPPDRNRLAASHRILGWLQSECLIVRPTVLSRFLPW